MTPAEQQTLLTLAALLREGMLVEPPADYGEIRQRDVGVHLARAARKRVCRVP